MKGGESDLLKVNPGVDLSLHSLPSVLTASPLLPAQEA